MSHREIIRDPDTGERLSHPCPGCGALGVPRHQLACKPCWLRLPADLRNAVNGTYRARSRGSADATRRSAVVSAHRRALAAAMEWYRDHPPAGRP